MENPFNTKRKNHGRQPANSSLNAVGYQNAINPSRRLTICIYRWWQQFSEPILEFGSEYNNFPTFKIKEQTEHEMNQIIASAKSYYPRHG
jgi:hypothetical protein